MNHINRADLVASFEGGSIPTADGSGSTDPASGRSESLQRAHYALAPEVISISPNYQIVRSKPPYPLYPSASRAFLWPHRGILEGLSAQICTSKIRVATGAIETHPDRSLERPNAVHGSTRTCTSRSTTRPHRRLYAPTEAAPNTKGRARFVPQQNLLPLLLLSRREHGQVTLSSLASPSLRGHIPTTVATRLVNEPVAARCSRCLDEL